MISELFTVYLWSCDNVQSLARSRSRSWLPHQHSFWGLKIFRKKLENFSGRRKYRHFWGNPFWTTFLWEVFCQVAKLPSKLNHSKLKYPLQAKRTFSPPVRVLILRQNYLLSISIDTWYMYVCMYVCMKDFMCLIGSICKMLLGSHASKCM